MLMLVNATDVLSITAEGTDDVPLALSPRAAPGDRSAMARSSLRSSNETEAS